MPSNSNIVVEWLRSLHLGQYAESFIDNGYDDLEICKQVGEPDLDAIGVLNPTHRQRLLASVRTLREEGAASVYFTLEEAAAAVAHEWPPGKEQEIVEEGARYRDEYEEGKAELVKIPRVQLRVLLRDRLAQDGIRLSLQPYSTTVSDTCMFNQPPSAHYTTSQTRHSPFPWCRYRFPDFKGYRIPAQLPAAHCTLLSSYQLADCLSSV